MFLINSLSPSAFKPVTLNNRNATVSFTQETLQNFIIEINEIKRRSTSDLRNQSETLFNDVSYQRHFVDSTLKNSLKQQMADIYSVWYSTDTTALTDNQKALIVDKIIEGSMNCSEGLFNRLQEIIESLQNQCSLLHTLSSLRESIIQRTAYAVSNDVHEHNQFFVVAAESGYGVNGNFNDKYRGKLSDKKIQSLVNKAMDKHYHPLAILKQAIIEIEVLLKTEHGYKGLQKDSNYPFHTITLWLDVIKTYLGSTAPFASNKIGIYTDDENYIPLFHDINWPVLLWEIYNYLKQDYFILLKEIETFFDFLLNPAISLNESSNFDLGTIIPLTKNYIFDLLSLIEDQKKIKYVFTQLTPKYQAFFLTYCIKNKKDKLLELCLATSSSQQIILSKNKTNTNILKTVIHHFPEITPYLLEAIITFDLRKAVSPFFQAIKDKPENRINALKQVNENGWNALMLAAHHQFKALISLIRIIDKLPLEDRNEILKQASANGRNVLMLALKHYRDKVPSLLRMIKKLPQKDQNELFKQVSKNGWNILMLAIRSHFKKISDLLEKINNLTLKDKADILKQINEYGKNALMLMASHSPKNISALLEAISKLTQKDQATILKQADSNGWNALMLTAFHSPKDIPALLEAISKLTLEDQATILKQVNSNGWNALMLMASHSPKDIPTILNLIRKLPLEDQVAIVKQINKNKENALLILAKYNHPKSVANLSKVIRKFPRESQSEIVKQVNSDGENALMLIAYHSPRSIPYFITIIDIFSPEEQTEILKQANNTGNALLMLMYKYYTKNTVSYFTNTISQLEQKDKTKILQQINEMGQNVLMVASQHSPHAVCHLLKIISELAPEDQDKVLKQVDKSGWNTFTLTACYHPEVIPELLDAVSKLIPTYSVDVTNLAKDLYQYRHQIQPNEIINILLTLVKLVEIGKLDTIDSTHISDLQTILHENYSQIAAYRIIKALWALAKLIEAGKLNVIDAAQISDLQKHLYDKEKYLTNSQELTNALWAIGVLHTITPINTNHNDLLDKFINYVIKSIDYPQAPIEEKKQVLIGIALLGLENKYPLSSLIDQCRPTSVLQSKDVKPYICRTAVKYEIAAFVCGFFVNVLVTNNNGSQTIIKFNDHHQNLSHQYFNQFMDKVLQKKGYTVTHITLDRQSPTLNNTHLFFNNPRKRMREDELSNKRAKRLCLEPVSNLI